MDSPYSGTLIETRAEWRGTLSQFWQMYVNSFSPSGNNRPTAEAQPREIPAPKPTSARPSRALVAIADSIREHG
jgi:hypothetical protein